MQHTCMCSPPTHTHPPTHTQQSAKLYKTAGATIGKPGWMTRPAASAGKQIKPKYLALVKSPRSGGINQGKEAAITADVCPGVKNSPAQSYSSDKLKNPQLRSKLEINFLQVNVEFTPSSEDDCHRAKPLNKNTIFCMHSCIHLHNLLNPKTESQRSDAACTGLPSCGRVFKMCEKRKRNLRGETGCCIVINPC